MQHRKECTAFSPGHITGFFEICRDPDSPLKTGSRGAGVSIARGVKTKVIVEPAHDKAVHIYFNDQVSENPFVSRHLVSLFLQKTGSTESWDIDIYHYIDIPIGYGLGSSGAGALSLAMALNMAMETALSFDEVVSLAHQAEVEMKTGLGTVMGIASGGIEIREKAGAPGYGKITRIETDSLYQAACILFGSLSTSRLLSDPEVQRKINASGKNLVDKLTRDKTPENFMLFSREFAYNTGLVNSRLHTIITGLEREGITASMLMFGDGIFVIEKTDKLKHVVNALTRFREMAEIMICDIDLKGARIL